MFGEQLKILLHKNSINSVLCLLSLSACQGVKNPDLQSPPVNQTLVSAEAPQAAEAMDPKVNIVFVVDNSGSMAPYQEKMAQNIERFAETFFENSRIDYRIGVVPVFDSRYLEDKTVYSSGVRKMNPLGELIRLRGEGVPSNQLYITRDTPNKVEILKKTVQIGTQWGPEAEESFSPVVAILDSQTNVEKNQGFYQEDAYLAVVFLTDADDVSPGLSPDQFYSMLVEAKNGQRNKIFIAAAIPNRNNSSQSCSKDGQGPVDSIPRLLAISGGITADLCSSDFGSKLANFGERIRREASSQRIPVGFEPDLKTLAVCYGPASAPSSVCGSGEAAEKAAGMVRLAPGARGFYYDNTPSKEAIVISPSAELIRIPSGKIFIRAKRILRDQLPNGRIEEL
jgi:hypothetical protein